MKLTLALLLSGIANAAVVYDLVTASCGSQTQYGGCYVSTPDILEEVSAGIGSNFVAVSTVAELGTGVPTVEEAIASGTVVDQQSEELDGVGAGIATLDADICVTGSLFPNGSASVQFGTASDGIWGGGCLENDILTTPFTYGVPFLMTITVESSESAVSLGESETGMSYVNIVSITLPPDPPVGSSVPEPGTFWMLAAICLLVTLMRLARWRPAPGDRTFLPARFW